MTREIHDDILPQHDFDAQKRIRWEITQKGRRALVRAAYAQGWSDAMSGLAPISKAIGESVNRIETILGR